MRHQGLAFSTRAHVTTPQKWSLRSLAPTATNQEGAEGESSRTQIDKQLNSHETLWSVTLGSQGTTV